MAFISPCMIGFPLKLNDRSSLICGPRGLRVKTPSRFEAAERRTFGRRNFVVCTASEGQNGIKTDYHTEQLLNDPNTDKFTKYIISQISTTNDPEQKKYLYQCLAQAKKSETVRFCC